MRFVGDPRDGAKNERLEGLNVTRPSLEDVYLQLTATGDEEESAE